MNSVIEILSARSWSGNRSPLYVLPEGERTNLLELLKNNFSAKFSEDDATYFIEKATADLLLSEDLQKSLSGFAEKSNELGVLLVRNLPVDPVVEFEKKSAFSETLLIKIASLLGKPFGYEDKRGGALIHNLVPVKEDAQKQLGSGSVELFWHTEDAHNKFNCDFIELLCLRGDPEAKTLASFIDPYALDPNMLQILSGPNFIISGDYTYNGAYEHRMPIINFSENDYRITFDPLYTKCVNDEAKKALDYLTKYVQDNAYYVVLEQGDLLIVDNRKSVHARSEYHPRYDGTDRWLQRIVSLKKVVPEDQLVQDRKYLIKRQ